MISGPFTSTRRTTPVIILTLALALGLSLAGPAAAEEVDPMTHDYEYVQPDEEGDVAVPGATWGDITELAISTLHNGTILLRMTFVDFSNALGDVMYIPEFTVGETAYQPGVRISWGTGQPLFVTSSGWSGAGDLVGTPTILVDDNAIVVWIEPDEIEGLEPGAVFTDIRVRVGALFGAPPGIVPPGAPSGAGHATFYDTLDPSESPTDFTYDPEVPDEGPEILYEDVDTPTINLDTSFDKPVNRTVLYNWTADGQDLSVRMDAAQAASGSVLVTVRDAAGTTLLQRELAAGEADDATILEPEGGAWQVDVTYTAFQGRFLLDVEPLEDDPDGAPPTDDPDDENEEREEENDDGDPEPGDTAGIPGPAVIVVIAAVLTGLALLRRR